MLPPLATVSALAARMGVDLNDWSPVDVARAEGALADASALAREEADQTWADTTVDPAVLSGVPDAVATIVLRAAKREMDNPHGYTSESDADYTYRRSAEDGVGVYFTEREVSKLRRYRPGGSSALYTITTTRGDIDCTTEWVWDNYGTEQIPWYTPEQGWCP